MKPLKEIVYEVKWFFCGDSCSVPHRMKIKWNWSSFFAHKPLGLL